MSENFYGEKRKEKDVLSDSGLQGSHDTIHRASYPENEVPSAEDAENI
jgi:hypothetical protein